MKDKLRNLLDQGVISLSEYFDIMRHMPNKVTHILTPEEFVKEFNEKMDSQYSEYDCNFTMMQTYAEYYHASRLSEDLYNKAFQYYDKQIIHEK